MKTGKQLMLFSDIDASGIGLKPVNVSSVPQRSPFRYPGGKTWFIPTFRRWINSKKNKPEILVEPFAGGGIVSLTALFEELVSQAIMIEIDEDVAAVWQSIVDGHSHWLAEQIIDFNLTAENIAKELQRKPSNIKERAFQTILKNRTLHGGILAEGAGFIKSGDNGKGIGSRWYPATLARRFNDLTSIADKITFIKTDGLKVIEKYIDNSEMFFFIDPPYTAGGKNAGKRLYTHNQIDHEYLFELCSSIKGDFLMTYDDSIDVKVMADKHGFHSQTIPMKNTHHCTMNELVISRNLSWLYQYTN